MIELPPMTKNRLRKNSKKKSSYASNKIEGNPLTEKQADEAIERDEHKHFLKPEQEIRNYFLDVLAGRSGGSIGEFSSHIYDDGRDARKRNLEKEI